MLFFPPNEYGCVCAWTSGPAIDLQKMPILAKTIIFSDEDYFDLGGYVNKQKCRIWGTENPHTYIEKPTHPKRVTVWWRFWPRGIIGPFFFENEQAEDVTVNGNRYRTMLNEFLFIKIEEEDIDNIWFQHDGTTCHTAEATLDVLRPALKIALSAAELMSLGHLGVAIWHHWTIICGVPSNISVTPTSQKHFTL